MHLPLIKPDILKLFELQDYFTLVTILIIFTSCVLLYAYCKQKLDADHYWA